jgi:transposase
MFFPEGQIRVHLYGAPCDMRRSFDGLQSLVRQGLGEDPTNGGLYVFVNRRGTQMRVLYFDRSGFCIWAKRLEAGVFVGDWSQVRTREMDWTALKLMLEGTQHDRSATIAQWTRHLRASSRARLRWPLSAQHSCLLWCRP